MYQRKPRTYEEVETLLEDLKWTVRALEKGQGKAIHEEEQSALKSLVNNHMRSENMKAFPNEAMRAATNEMMVRYSNILDTDPRRVSLESFHNEWLRMWRRVMSPSAAVNGNPQQMEQSDDQEERHKAMAVSIDQARAEARAKTCGKGGLAGQGMEDMIMVRKELSDLKSQFNQLKQENAQLKREQMEGGMGKSSGRGGYQGNGARNYNTGGWGRENRGIPYKQRGGYRPNMQRPAQTPLEEKRETGFYMRSMGIEESPDCGGGGQYFARRVRIRGEITTEDLRDPEERELFKVPIMIMDGPEVEIEAIGKRTRAGSQRKEELTKTVSQVTENHKEEEMEEMPKLEDMTETKEDETSTGPERSSEQYAWSTGGAEMEPEKEQLKCWMEFTEDPEYNQIRRASLLRPLGVEAREAENLDQLLTYFPWSGHTSIQMPAGQVWGLAKEERILRCNLELREGAEPEERLGLLMDMEGIRKEIAQQHMEEDEERMHESPECWWYHKQVKENMHRLHERLGMLVQEADQGLMDVKHFTLAYDYIMLNYARREGKFTWELYERDRVYGEHAQYYAFESGAETIMTQDGNTGYPTEENMAGRSVEYEALDNAKAETIKSMVNKLEENGMGANEHKKTPDWVSPAEGIEAGEEAGEQDVD